MGYKVLGQVTPSANTATDVLTVGSGLQVVVSTIAICNRSSAATYRIAVRKAGASIDNKHYIVYDAALPANSSDLLTLGLTLEATDVVTVTANSANVSFNLFGTDSP